MRGILKRASVVRHPESESQKRIALDTAGSDTTPSCLTRRIIGVRCTTQRHHTDQGTGTSDAARANSEEHIDGDVAMGGDSADDNSARQPTPSGSDSRRRITAKRETREVRVEQSSTTEQHVPRRLFGVDDASRTCSCRHHARGTGRVPVRKQLGSRMSRTTQRTGCRFRREETRLDAMGLQCEGSAGREMRHITV